MEKNELKIPNNLENLLYENITKKSLNENSLNNVKEKFDAQQSKRFQASLTFPKWNMEFREFLWKMDNQIFESWHAEYDDIVLSQFEKNIAPQEAALTVLKEIERSKISKFSKTRRKSK